MNQRTPTQQPAPRRVQGSWEDLFLQAQQHARNYNDLAIPLYEKVLNGLMALPESARQSGNRRLHNLMMAAGLDLQGYYNVRDGFDESLAVVEKLKTVAVENEQEMLDTLKTDILLLSGRTDEAYTRLRTTAEAPEADLGDWGALVAAYLKAEQPADALPILDQMDAQSQAKHGDNDDEDAKRDRSYVAGLRALATFDAGNVDEGVKLFEEVIAVGGAYAANLHLIYGRLVHQGRYDDALRFIDMDRGHPVRAGFWRGVTLHHLGHASAARAAFQSVVAIDVGNADRESMMEFILARYYLGDPEGTGLEIVLRGIREQRAPNWAMLFLTGLGWVLRGDMNSARSNLQLAVTQRKSAADGAKLPKHYWFFTKDIAPADKLADLQTYFDPGEFA